MRNRITALILGAAAVSMSSHAQAIKEHSFVGATKEDENAIRAIIESQSADKPDVRGGECRALLAPSYTSASSVSLFGQIFDNSVDGVIQRQVVTVPVIPQNGVYSVSVQATSATLLRLRQ